MKAAQIRVLLADDHPFVREGIRASLAAQSHILVVGEASSGEEAVLLADKLKPDIILLDLSMPGMGGIAAAKELKRRSPKTKAIIVSMHDEREYVRQMASSGARGYLLKDSSPQDLVRAIDAVQAGKTFFSPSISEALLDEVSGDGGDNRGQIRLTQRETEVLKLIADGLSNKEVAKRLGISVRTAETHRERVMEKLDIRTVAGLTKYALSQGLITLK